MKRPRYPRKPARVPKSREMPRDAARVRRRRVRPAAVGMEKWLRA